MKHIDKLASPFACYAKHLLLESGNRAAALRSAEDGRAVQSVCDILRSAVSAGTTTDANWASALSPYRSVAGAFLESLEPFSAFQRIAADGAFAPGVMHATIGVVSVGASGGTFGERETKTPTKIELDNGQMKERKVASFAAFTDELIRFGGASALGLISRELRKAVAIETDRAFLAAIAEQTGAYSTAGTGTSPSALIADLSEAMEHLSVGASSRVYLIASPKYVTAMAMARGTSGPTYPGVGLAGGVFQGMSVIPSDAATDAILLNASQMLVDQGTVVLDASNQASLQMDSDPTDGVAATVNLFQSNMRALRVERIFACELLSSSGASVISNTTA
jgi:hypothetical protein